MTQPNNSNKPDWTRSTPKWLLVTAVVPAAFLGFTAWWVWEELSFRDDAVRTTAEVVAVDRNTGTDGTTYTPTYEFQTEDGTTIRKTPRASSSEPIAKRSKVPILYDPENPERSRRVAPLMTWVPPIVTGLIGLCALVVGVGSKLGIGLPGGSHADIPLHRR